MVLGGGFGVGISLFELSIGLWIATEIVVKFPNIYGELVQVFCINYSTTIW